MDLKNNRLLLHAINWTVAQDPTGRVSTVFSRSHVLYVMRRYSRIYQLIFWNATLVIWKIFIAYQNLMYEQNPGQIKK